MTERDAGTVEVVDNPEKHQYEARDQDGSVLGISRYRMSGQTVVFTHTEVDPSAEGRGIGSTLVRGALDDVRRHGRLIRPLCPFVKAYVERHPAYVDLVDPDD